MLGATRGANGGYLSAAASGVDRAIHVSTVVLLHVICYEHRTSLQMDMDHSDEPDVIAGRYFTMTR